MKYELIYYSLKDEIIGSWSSYKECAKYFETSPKVIHCYISRSLRKPNKKKRDKKAKTWGYLIKIDIEND